MILRNSKGFSLVEVLIALIIMSVGMLGIAGLYVQSMQAGRTSMLRHHAVTLAGDVADRIRANPAAGAAYAASPGQNFNCVSAFEPVDHVVDVGEPAPARASTAMAPPTHSSLNNRNSSLGVSLR